MSSFVDNLNLRPQEKRVLVGIAVIAFVVLNLLFVFPHFHDWVKIRGELDQTRRSITNYTVKIAEDNDPKNGLKHQVDVLEKQQGAIEQHEAGLALNQTVTTEARACGFVPRAVTPTTPIKLGTASQSDKYFESQSVRVDIQSSEEALVKFLYDVGNDPAMIRVFELSLGPADTQRYQLHANVTLTADYKKTVNTNTPPPKKTSLVPGATKPAGPTNATAGARGNPAKNNSPPAPPAPAARRGPVMPPRMPVPPGVRGNQGAQKPVD